MRVATSYNGQIEGTFFSLLFGDGYQVSGSDGDPSHFAMLDKDYYGGSNSGTDHALFRQYANMAGRWMSPDPDGGSYDLTNPQSMNRYAYGMNGPLTFVDPLGLYVDGPGQCSLGAGDPCGGGTIDFPDMGGFCDASGDCSGIAWGNDEGDISGYLGGLEDYYPAGSSSGGVDMSPTGGQCSVGGGSGLGGLLADAMAIASGRYGSSPAKDARVCSAPSSGQSKKKHCRASTRIAGLYKAFDGAITTTGMGNLALLGYYGSFFIVGASCAPEPGVFVTCPAGLFAGGSLAASATVMGYGAYKVANEEMIPGITQAITCTETE